MLNFVFFEDEKETEQQFFTFYENKIKAGNYIGSIKYKDRQFQILPKIFLKERYPKEFSDSKTLNKFLSLIPIKHFRVGAVDSFFDEFYGLFLLVCLD